MYIKNFKYKTLRISVFYRPLLICIDLFDGFHKSPNPNENIKNNILRLDMRLTFPFR